MPRSQAALNADAQPHRYRVGAQVIAHEAPIAGKETELQGAVIKIPGSARSDTR